MIIEERNKVDKIQEHIDFIFKLKDEFNDKIRYYIIYFLDVYIFYYL